MTALPRTCWLTRSSRSTQIGPSNTPVDGPGSVVHVMPKPGVTDPEAASALELLAHLGYPVSNVRTIRTYRVEGPAGSLPRLVQRVLANDAVEMAVVGHALSGPARPAKPIGSGRSRCRSVTLHDADLLHLSRSASSRSACRK